MKESIDGVLSYPYLDKLEIRVYRLLDRFHVATVRTYSARYSNPEKVYRLANRFVTMNKLVQEKIIKDRIERWKS